jgi:hypothetical protein
MPLVEYLPVNEIADPRMIVSPTTFAMAGPPAISTVEASPAITTPGLNVEILIVMSPQVMLP